MAKNTLKNTLKEKEDKGKRKKKSSGKKINLDFQWYRELKHKTIEFFTNDQNRQIFGLIFLFFSGCMFISFLSYYFGWFGGGKGWTIDQSEIQRAGNGLSYIFNNEYEGNNWLGKLGSFISHYFLYARFGLSSFLIVFLLAILGIRLSFKVNLYSIKKALKLTLLFCVWGSSLLSLLSSQVHYNGDLGGGFGFHLNHYLSSIMGTTGLAFLLVVSLFIILITNFNFSFDMMKGMFNSSDEEISIKENSNTIKTNDSISETTAFNGETISETDSVTENIDSSAESEVKEFTLEDKPSETQHNIDNVYNETVSSHEELTQGFTTETKGSDDFKNKEEDSGDSEVLDLDISSIEAKNPTTEGDLTLTVEETEEEEVLSDSEVNKKVQEFGQYDPKLDLSAYQLPPLELLVDHGDGKHKVSQEELEINKNNIVETLLNYKIEISQIKATIGPTVTLYEIVPAPGVRISKIKNLEDDIALSLAALGIRIIAPIPGKGTIGIEVPNSKPDVVSMRAVIKSEKFVNSDMDLPVALGKTIQNETYVTDLAKMPHLLMAGATGQGKSVGLNCILASLLYKKHPSQLKFVLVDPKKVELTLFNKIERHFLAKLPDSEEAIITDTSKVVQTVNSLCVEMDNRYEMLKNAHCRNIKEYNKKFMDRKLNPEKGHKYLPYIVLVIDEFADLIMTAGKDIETPIARLAQLARAIGIHLIVATQRPSVNIITGTIKANFPARIAFRVTAKIDSRTILDAGGADQLIGRGDMLLSTGSDLIRLQCAFVDTPEVEEICTFIGEQRGYPSAFMLPEYEDPNAESGVGDIDASDRDVLFEEAARLVVMSQQGSASMLQRKLKLGYNRAGRIVDQLEAAGIIGPFEGSKARKVLIPDDYSLEQFLNNEQQNGNL